MTMDSRDQAEVGGDKGRDLRGLVTAILRAGPELESFYMTAVDIAS